MGFPCKYMHVETNRRRIRSRLQREGWYLLRHGSGHDIYRRPSIFGVLILPRHRRVSPAVTRSIAKKTGWKDSNSNNTNDK
ncbi:MAG: addiction module toxin, HicA family [Gammaproteobacteria bacterium]|nr:addiction module toxin, HicA family [Gammaproteobacteria bacterium]MYD00819.1 addiction module toxin, HicA family [Gammaproteobacteria bacterium]MYI23826.1 addiction module toxin, HicA family [Gammaproteobacteria bacterium]